MHPLVRFAIKNLNKSKVRSGLSILAVFFGVLLITTLLVMTDSLVAAVDDSLDILSGVVVVQQENAVDPTFSIVDTEVINRLEQANASDGLLEGLVSSYTEQIWYVERSDVGIYGFLQAVGLKPSSERATVGILNMENIVAGRTLEDTDFNATVVGIDAATVMNVQVGDFINVADRNVSIVGIFESDSIIDNSMFMPLELVQQFSPQYSSGQFVSTILVKPLDLAAGQNIKNFINDELGNTLAVEASDFEEIAEQGREFLDLTTEYALYLGLISIVIGSLSVFNAILMSVMERKREIAVLKATGWSDNEVGLEVFIESIVISAIGGIFGLIGGLFIAHFVTSASDILELVILPWTLIQSYIFAVVLGILAGLYPAMRAMRIDPVKDLSG